MKMIGLEFQKIKRTTMYFTMISLSVLPVIMILLRHLVSNDPEKKFYTTVANNNIVITICLYTVFIILTNYIITREYRDRTMIYLFITPQSRKKILMSKFGLLFILLFCLGSLTYGSILILNLIFGGVNGEIITKMVGAWLASVVLSFFLMPFIAMIALWRKNFISSMMISLVLIIFTIPFMFKENIYVFPHLIPMAVSNNLLRIQNKLDIDYLRASIILAAVCVICSLISMRLFNRKE